MKKLAILGVLLSLTASAYPRPETKATRWPQLATQFPADPRTGCPGGYLRWTYRAGRPPICVQEA